MTPQYLENLRIVYGQAWGWTLLWVVIGSILIAAAIMFFKKLVNRPEHGLPDELDFIYLTVCISCSAASVPFFLMALFKLHSYRVFGG